MAATIPTDLPKPREHWEHKEHRRAEKKQPVDKKEFPGVAPFPER
ncbi:hypothetical protein SXCC_04426 [Gluconacetobacter sp. SXCC-1]|nr:hypothetical protein SXCC_04426 [Gluconacetobacter sp. SXCC-1]